MEAFRDESDVRGLPLLDEITEMTVEVHEVHVAGKCPSRPWKVEINWQPRAVSGQ